MRSIVASLTVLVLGGATGGAALAEPPDEPPPPPPRAASSDGEPTGERVVLPAKRLYGRAMLEIELSTGAAFDPVSLAPDLYYGVSQDFTVGLVHSSVGSTGIIGGSGSSLCFTGACDGTYHNFGLDGRYQLKTGNVSTAAELGLFANDLDPLRLALKLGVIGRYRASPTSKLAVDFAPALFLGVTEREPEMTGGTGNKEVFVVPGTVLYAATPRLTALLQLGLVIPFENAGDLYSVPFSIGASFAVSKQLSIEGAFSLPRLLGGGEQTGADSRSLTIGGGYAF